MISWHGVGRRVALYCGNMDPAEQVSFQPGCGSLSRQQLKGGRLALLGVNMGGGNTGCLCEQ